MYRCASISSWNEELVEEKWLSLLNHLNEVHDGHGKLFKKCIHDKIEREWFNKGKKNIHNWHLLVQFFFCMNDSIDPQESGQYRNENSSRKQAKTKLGKERWRVNHPKHKERAVAKDIKAKPTFVEKGFHTTLPK